MKQLSYLFVAALLCFSMISRAASEASVPRALVPMLSEAIALHTRARDGDGKAALLAAERFKTFLEKHPGDAVTLAYLGSSYALAGRHADVLIDKVRYTNRGIRFLDQALEKGPDNFTVRVIRANVNLGLPEMFKRTDAARADIEKLDRLYESASSREGAEQMAPLYAALAKSQSGVAASSWEAKSRAAASFSTGRKK